MMDRFVVREPRVGADFPQGQGAQMVEFGLNTPRNNNTMIPENMYLGGYGREFPTPQHMNSPGFFGAHQQMSSNYLGPQPMNIHRGQAQMMSGIDPRYLGAYSDGNAQFIATGQNMQNERPYTFGGEYENRTFAAPDRKKPMTTQVSFGDMKTRENVPEEKNIYKTLNNAIKDQPGLAIQNYQQIIPNVANKSSNEYKLIKEEPSIKIVSRFDKLKALHNSGPRVFSGPVEKVLKWHKALQEIGILVIYEIVAKCVSVRPGESCAKNLVVRDDSGPAMQVVYYEIDFLLPELKLPCTVRVVGRMLGGTCRLQAFSVRPATGDDVSTLTRRAAVASHHVAKLCKEYGVNL